MSRRIKSCCVPHCRSKTGNKVNKINFFRCPKDYEARVQWHRCMRRTGNILLMRDVVCEKHFTPGQIVYKWQSADETRHSEPKAVLVSNYPPFYPERKDFDRERSKWYLEYIDEDIDDTEYNFSHLDTSALEKQIAEETISSTTDGPSPPEHVFGKLLKLIHVRSPYTNRLMSLYDASEIIARGYQHNL